ncbi:fatty acyl-CoA reductase wat-like [Leptidea sinapis]|uniref:fatty acyl-CoA reductase wat-like n=1 Tax=Leptidea sinapis TaxID=189913 RepID=UPI00212756E2|nr:fatty acyl-CoA reductase wat-like [Leptidea sinapis]XP_050664687.1 fatty acyl-CoA reductase wat-like [Leptidea sinapis]XP_050664688.1 fatty acyl-CoA reductase wat-like [Leptidea sinapis]
MASRIDSDIAREVSSDLDKCRKMLQPDSAETIDKTVDVMSIDFSKNKIIDSNMNEKNLARSEIQRFYDGKNVLITGATGFLGKILVEKLLRSCPGVENLYLLVRQKRGKDIYSRMEEIFDDPMFDRLKEVMPKFRHKIVVVPADCESYGLGLAITDRQMLIEKVNVIFHSAATVKFDEHLRAALATNVQAPLYLLDLARNMKGLKVFMHISTAYSNSHLSRVEEKYYPCEADSAQLQQMIDKLTDKQITTLLPKVLGKWPNTYTFTKALTEKELRKHCSGVPLSIFRPAIVTSTAREPLKCWLDNMYGPTGVAVGSVTGMLRTIQVNRDMTADLVPVDFVVNALIAASYSVSQAYNTSVKPQEPPIFNFVSSVENRMTWGDFFNQNMKRVDRQPVSNAVWYISLTLTKSALINRINMIFLHFIPAVILDFLSLCVGRKPQMLKVYRKIHKFSSVISYFTTKEIYFCNRRTQELWNTTSDLDKQIFPFSMKDINWDEYFEYYLQGIRQYLFKESEDTVPQARIKWRRLYYLHQIVRVTFFAFVIYLIWTILDRLI